MLSWSEGGLASHLPLRHRMLAGLTTFYLARHGEVRDEPAEERRLRSTARDVIPLSAAGVRQIEETATIL